MNIVVVCGGGSSERNVSLKSGKAIHAALKSCGYQSRLLDFNPESFQISELNESEVVFIALHGEYGEDGQFQKVLQDAGIVYTGSGPLACEASMDKLNFREVLMRQKIQMPILLTSGTKDQLQLERVEYPSFIKPAVGGSSIGVTKLNASDQLADGINKAFHESNRVLIEKAVSGREFAVGVVSERALQPIEICTDREYFDYEAKYSDPGTKYIFPLDLSAECIERMKSTALRVHSSLGCEVFSRVDMIWDGKDIYVLELNAVPGMTERSLLPLEAEHDGIPFAQLCDMIVQETIKKNKFVHK